MDIPEEKFNLAKEEAEEFYKGIGMVHCPYLNDRVSFNTKGLEHLKFKEKNKARLLVDQYMRLRLLKLAPSIINQSNTIQEFYETWRMEKQNINSDWQSRRVLVKYYGFIAIVNGARIKIIVKEIQGGNKYFWSLIPFWKSHQKGSGNIGDSAFGNKKILHAGDLERD